MQCASCKAGMADVSSMLAVQHLGAFGSFNEPYYRSFITTDLGVSQSTVSHSMCASVA